MAKNQEKAIDINEAENMEVVEKKSKFKEALSTAKDEAKKLGENKIVKGVVKAVGTGLVFGAGLLLGSKKSKRDDYDCYEVDYSDVAVESTEE